MRTLLAAGLLLASAGTAAESLPITPRPVPGGIALVPLTAEARAPLVHYRGERVLLRRLAGRWQAVVGIPLSVTPGQEVLEVDGRPLAFAVGEQRYAEQRLSVTDQRQVTPNAEDLARIAREQTLMAPAWRSWQQGLSASLHFRQPTAGELSSSFGLRRYFNGEARAPHSGLDIAAPPGQEVRAPAEGVVVLTGDFFFNGKSVFLAHGEGLVTLYCHLQAIAVRPGQRLKAGTLLGRVGQTGRATGPHLHWSVSLNNARVDPQLFLAGTP